LVIWKSQ